MFVIVGLKTIDTSEQFNKPVVHNINRFFVPVYIPEYDLQGIAIVTLVQRFLRSAMIFSTGLDNFPEVIQTISI